MKKLLAIAPLLTLAACGSSTPPPSFAPLDYSYLKPFNFKVATLNVVNNYVPGPDEAALNANNPAPPGDTLMAMLNARMQPSGEAGSGTVSVQTASITEADGSLNGQMTVDIQLSSPDGRSTGAAEATVSASNPAPDGGPDSNEMRAALYNMTKQLMTAMNVQLPYQIIHNIPSWVSWTTPQASAGLASPAAGMGGGIQATPLGAPGSTPASTPASAPASTPASQAAGTTAVPPSQSLIPPGFQPAPAAPVPPQ